MFSRILFCLTILATRMAAACPTISGDFGTKLADGRMIVARLSQKNCTEFTRVWRIIGSDGKIRAEINQTIPIDSSPVPVPFDVEGTVKNASATYKDTAVVITFDINDAVTGVRYTRHTLSLEKPDDQKSDLETFVELLDANGHVVSQVKTHASRIQ
jgi:hypothetical protein